MNPKSPLVQFSLFMEKGDMARLVWIPVFGALVIVCFLMLGNPRESVGFLVDISPVISSIILGFMGMILVAALSNTHIFDLMRKTPIDTESEISDSVYHVFVLGLCMNMSLELGLLFCSIIFGLINSAFDLQDLVYCFELFMLVFLLISSSLLFINNMDRIAQVTLYDNP